MNESDNETEALNEWFRSIGYNITWYRRCCGLTQETLAEKVDISRTHLAAIEAPNSTRRPSMEVLFRISRILGVSPEKLMKPYREYPNNFENR